MIYKELSSSIWDELKIKEATNPNMIVNLQLISEQRSTLPYISIFISTDDSLHFICEVGNNKKEIDLKDFNIAGIEIDFLKNTLILGRERQSYINLKCTGYHHKEEFTNLVKEICDQVFYWKIDIYEAVNIVMRRNISFWGKNQKRVLSEEQQLGLYGELIVLEKLLDICGLDVALNSWAGPKGGMQDFSLNNGLIEVKTTFLRKHQHTINGLEQLNPLNKEIPLLLVSNLVEVSNEGENLTEIVERIITKLNFRPDLVEYFLSLINKVNYDKNHSNYYSFFFLYQSIGFIVDEHFPTLNIINIEQPLSSRIRKITYVLDMEGLPGVQLTDDFLISYCK